MHYRNVGYIADMHTVRRLKKISVINKSSPRGAVLYAVKRYADSSGDKTFRRNISHHSSDLRARKARKQQT
jgi:hypothetical protein